MLTIWNKFIQGLVMSGDMSSLELAMLLVDSRLDIYHWWATCYVYNSTEDGQLNDSHLPWLSRDACFNYMRDGLNAYSHEYYESPHNSVRHLNNKYLKYIGYAHET